MEASVSAAFQRPFVILLTDYSEEEDPDEYPFPLTLRSKRSTGPTSPADGVLSNGNGV